MIGNAGPRTYVSLCGCGERRRQHRQADVERGADAGDGLERDGAAVAFDDRAADREPLTGAATDLPSS
jgi:hypothetical protein